MPKPPEEDGFNTDAPTLVRHVSGTGKLIGTIFGNQYKIIEVIGEGGIGVVYRARQLTVDRDVAIKILKRQFANDELAARRFENEATAISRLRHPNTLRLYDCQRTPGGDLYIVTELLTGSPLGDVLKQLGRLPIERAVRTFDEVCRSLCEAHAAGIVHRDLKPANIFLDRIGNEDVVKVLDFGIAKILQGNAGLTRAGAIPGTPHYMSPEQSAAQRVDHRADIYSMGVILFQMITGKPPFDGSSVMDILQKHITEAPPKISDVAPEVTVPAELEKLIFWMLEKAPEDRPQSVESIRPYLPGILAAVAPVRPLLVAGSPFTAYDSPPPEELASSGAQEVISPLASPSLELVREASRSQSRWRSWSLATGVVGILLGVVIGYATTRREVVIAPKNELTSHEQPAVVRPPPAEPPPAATATVAAPIVPPKPATAATLVEDVKPPPQPAKKKKGATPVKRRPR